jgi:hypothetical protein
MWGMSSSLDVQNRGRSAAIRESPTQRSEKVKRECTHRHQSVKTDAKGRRVQSCEGCRKVLALWGREVTFESPRSEQRTVRPVVSTCGHSGNAAA